MPTLYERPNKRILPETAVSDILYRNYRQDIRHSTVIQTDWETGLPLICTAQDTTPILESAKAMAANFDKHSYNRDMTHVARIPAVIYNNLKRLGITRDPEAFRAWLNSREARLLRTDDGRKL